VVCDRENVPCEAKRYLQLLFEVKKGILKWHENPREIKWVPMLGLPVLVLRGEVGSRRLVWQDVVRERPTFEQVEKQWRAADCTRRVDRMPELAF
jgi:hypothetical protein